MSVVRLIGCALGWLLVLAALLFALYVVARAPGVAVY